MATPKVKSPHYPAMNLESAIKKARELVASLGRGPLSRESAITGIGLSPKSSSGQRTLAALLSFGLWEKAGKGRVQLSERGRRILAAPDLSMAAKEVAESGLMPRIHRRVMQQWPDGLPTEDNAMLGFLRMEWDFNPDAAAPFIREVRETFSFAKVYENASMGLDLAENGEDGDDEADEEQPEQPRREGLAVKPSVVPGSPVKNQTPAPRTLDGGPMTMELTSFPLIGGGRIILEVPVPTPPEQLLKVATMAATITQHLAIYLATSESSKTRPTSEDS